MMNIYKLMSYKNCNYPLRTLEDTDKNEQQTGFRAQNIYQVTD